MVFIKRGVNYIPDRGNIYDESYEELLAKSCKWCSIKMVWRDDIENYFCCYCAWQPPPPPKQQQVKAEKHEGVNKSMRSIKQKVKINKNPDDDIFIKPVCKTRTQELADHRRKEISLDSMMI